jgi:hypothetical protein
LTDAAVFSIIDECVCEGNLPSNKRKLLEAWIEIHKEELLADWGLAVDGNNVCKIEPLK